MVAHLSRPLSNIGGPAEKVRRLYTNVIGSMITYESPIWAGSITLKSGKVIRRVQRRIVRGYRTISHDTSLALAGMVPFGILAEADKRGQLNES